MPKPVLSILGLSFPLASSDLGANSLENEFLMRKLQLSQVHTVHVHFQFCTMLCVLCDLFIKIAIYFRFKIKWKKWLHWVLTPLHMMMKHSTWRQDLTSAF